MKNNYEKIYDWENLISLFEEFVPNLVEMQKGMKEETVIASLPESIKSEIKDMDFNEVGRDPRDIASQLVDDIYPYRYKVNHPRYFCFIPGNYSPYSVFAEFLSSFHNPYAAGYDLSEGTVLLEEKTIEFLGSSVGYDKKRLGGQFVSGGSMANLTAAIVARDDKLEPEEFIKGTVYVSDQTHSSAAKAVRIMGISPKNIRIISSGDDFKINTHELKETICKDIEDGYKPFLLVGSCGTTNTGSIDSLTELSEISKKYNLWFHIDGAYGASALLSSHKNNLKGVEFSDSISWDGHKWLFQTYGCAAIICRDKKKLLNTFSISPEYLKDVESTQENLNPWDMGIEMTKPARGIRLWFTLQTVGMEAMRAAVDRGFTIADWIEEEVLKYERFEIVSRSQMGIITFRFYDEKYTGEELDKINKSISMRAMEESYSAFLTTQLKGKVVLRFCANNALTTRAEIKKVIGDIQIWIEELKI